MSDKVWFDPTSDKWVLNDGEHYLEVPHWAREIIVNEFERETRQLKTENAKLRELCTDMLMSPQDYCEKYGIEYEGWSSADDHIDTRMRELGVEV